jgi:signal transduction histidine kinase
VRQRAGNPQNTQVKPEQRIAQRCLLNIAFALSGTASATLLRLAIAPLAGSAVPYVTYFGAAIALAWFRGFWTAALSIVLSAAAGAHYFLAADSVNALRLGGTQRAAVIGFSLVSLATSWLIALQRELLARAQAAEAAQSVIANENARLLEDAGKAQENLERSNHELQIANRDLEIFAYSANHDLQEPLRTIILSAALLERRWGNQLPDEAAQMLRHLLAATRRMNVLMEDLLAYRRAGMADTDTPPNIEVEQVLNEVVERLKDVIHESEAAVTAGTLPRVAIHHGRLAQVLQNLISNAIKYRGKEPPRVHVDAIWREGWWELSVADNGMGIEMQFANRIFELFKRLHSQERYPGSGIGLAICKRLVEQYGGQIYLKESEPARGSTFCFTVPPAHE